MINREARQLRDAILKEAHARGVHLEQEGLALEQGLPVLRLRLGGVVLRSTRIRLPGTPGRASCLPDVITVHGSGFRRSRMWPRKLDGTFKIVAIVDHLLALVDEELGRPKPHLRVAVGAAASASGVPGSRGAYRPETMATGPRRARSKPTAAKQRLRSGILARRESRTILSPLMPNRELPGGRNH